MLLISLASSLNRRKITRQSASIFCLLSALNFKFKVFFWHNIHDACVDFNISTDAQMAQIFYCFLLCAFFVVVFSIFILSRFWGTNSIKTDQNEAIKERKKEEKSYLLTNHSLNITTTTHLRNKTISIKKTRNKHLLYLDRTRKLFLLVPHWKKKCYRSWKWRRNILWILLFVYALLCSRSSCILLSTALFGINLRNWIVRILTWNVHFPNSLFHCRHVCMFHLFS